MESTEHRVVVIGAGAAGAAAVRGLASVPGIGVCLLASSGEYPYNRTLVNKAVALGFVSPEGAATPDLGVEMRADSATAVNLLHKTVSTASGSRMPFDSLVVATGSAPRRLDSVVSGLREAVSSGRLTTLHSLADGVRVRDILAGIGDRAAHIVVLGAGLLGAETASLLADRGHDVTLVARSSTPGVGAMGAAVGARIADAHRDRIATRFGCSPIGFHTQEQAVYVALDDGSTLLADLVVVALGTEPTAPAPWRRGVDVDDRLRYLGAANVLAAGGVAVHHDERLGTWRSDHWDDAASQGSHSAAALLHHLGLAADPGPYVPRAMFAARIHGRDVMGFGLVGEKWEEQAVSIDPLVVVHRDGAAPVGAVGVDAPLEILAWSQSLLQSPSVALGDVSKAGSYGSATSDEDNLKGGAGRPPGPTSSKSDVLDMRA